MGSIPTISQFFFITLSFLPFFFPSFALFSPPFLSSSKVFLPFPPALPFSFSYSFPIPFLSFSTSCFLFFFPFLLLFFLSFLKSLLCYCFLVHICTSKEIPVLTKTLNKIAAKITSFTVPIIQYYMDTNNDHFTPLALRMWGIYNMYSHFFLSLVMGKTHAMYVIVSTT